MKTFAKFPHAFLMQAGPFRAWLEMTALGGGLIAGSLLLLPNMTIGNLQNWLFVMVLSAVSLFALRMKLFPQPWYRRLVSEFVLGAGLAFLLALLLIWLSFSLANQVIVAPQPNLLAITGMVLEVTEVYPAEPLETGAPPALAFVELFSSISAYFVMRLGACVIQFWARLQRRHLIWALTNSHLLLVIVGAFLGSLFLVVSTVNYSLTSHREQGPWLVVLIVTLVPFLVAIGIIMVPILAVVLPPAAALSYFTIRRTTRRLDALKAATGALRAGNYQVRVAVQGEDEVAALQEDFNMMAADLEQAVADLASERDAVKTLLRDRRELMASVSHELRTPVAILRGHLEAMAANSQNSLSPEVLADVTVMAQQTVSLQRMIDDLFTLSRAEVGQLEVHRQQTDLGEVVERCVAAVAPVFWRTHRVEVVAEVSVDLTPVLVDELRLEQVVYNLLRNSVRHTPPGGIVAVSVAQNGEQAAIQVKDTGEGIAPDVLPHIWDRYYRTDGARTRDADGAGLGLALVKELVEAMDGTVAVASKAGQGTCFTIQLPV